MAKLSKYDLMGELTEMFNGMDNAINDFEDRIDKIMLSENKNDDDIQNEVSRLLRISGDIISKVLILVEENKDSVDKILDLSINKRLADFETRVKELTEDFSKGPGKLYALSISDSDYGIEKVLGGYKMTHGTAIYLEKEFKHDEYNVMYNGLYKDEVSEIADVLSTRIYAYSTSSDKEIYELITGRPVKLWSDDSVHDIKNFVYCDSMNEVEPSAIIAADISFIRKDPEFTADYIYYLEEKEAEKLSSITAIQKRK